MPTYVEAVNQIYELPKFTSKHSFEEGRMFLDKLGAPDKKFKIIHVAGTNGKGSVCAYMESILMHAGYKTGCFISPHLVDCRERIRINGCMCSEEAFLRAYEKIDALGKKLFVPTFFEYLFFMAMLIFEEEKPDIVILETGLGGRLDATNLVSDKLAGIITSIGLDHTEYLGDTVESIASEKAGIAALGRPLIYWDDTPGASVISDAANRRQSVEIALSKSVISDVHRDNRGIDFCLRYKYDSYICPHVSTQALYQVENAALAVCSLVNIPEFEGHITEDDILEGLRGMTWPGRMEELEPGIFLDGAHNEAAFTAFLGSVREDGALRRLLIFGCMRDKDYRSEIGLLAGSGLFEKAVAVSIDSARAESCDVIADTFEEMNMPVIRARDAKEALDIARDHVKNKDSYAYIAGSLYLAGEVKGLI
ncbi:MAG: bifunctional folylpolyglutamate synthase/dihydrofolate synthase [Lachnospiraceae bacterium]|nr:bifunctional folylpolyglutamate synthase/dihydrofolate synthase [Lachnospiraceae bacterium]